MLASESCPIKFLSWGIAGVPAQQAQHGTAQQAQRSRQQQPAAATAGIIVAIYRAINVLVILIIGREPRRR